MDGFYWSHPDVEALMGKLKNKSAWSKGFYDISITDWTISKTQDTNNVLITGRVLTAQLIYCLFKAICFALMHVRMTVDGGCIAPCTDMQVLTIYAHTNTYTKQVTLRFKQNMMMPCKETYVLKRYFIVNQILKKKQSIFGAGTNVKTFTIPYITFTCILRDKHFTINISTLKLIMIGLYIVNGIKWSLW